MSLSETSSSFSQSIESPSSDSSVEEVDGVVFVVVGGTVALDIMLGIFSPGSTVSCWLSFG